MKEGFLQKSLGSTKLSLQTFNAGTKVETANVDKRAMTYLYQEGDDFVFMDAGSVVEAGPPARAAPVWTTSPTSRKYSGEL